MYSGQEKTTGSGKISGYVDNNILLYKVNVRIYNSFWWIGPGHQACASLPSCFAIKFRVSQTFFGF